MTTSPGLIDVRGERAVQGQLTVAAAEEGRETEQVEEEGDHRAGIVSGSELRDQ